MSGVRDGSGRLNRSVWNSGGNGIGVVELVASNMSTGSFRAERRSFASNARRAVAWLIWSSVAAATSTAGIVGVGAGARTERDDQALNIEAGILALPKVELKELFESRLKEDELIDEAHRD